MAMELEEIDDRLDVAARFHLFGPGAPEIEAAHQCAPRALGVEDDPVYVPASDPFSRRSMSRPIRAVR